MFSARKGSWPFDRHYEADSAFVPSTNPANAPAVDAVAQRHGLEQAQELDFDFHGNTWMALTVGTVKVFAAEGKVMATTFTFHRFLDAAAIHTH